MTCHDVIEEPRDQEDQNSGNEGRQWLQMAIVIMTALREFDGGNRYNRTKVPRCTLVLAKLRG